jgi:hypothetical protein
MISCQLAFGRLIKDDSTSKGQNDDTKAEEKDDETYSCFPWIFNPG